MTFETSTAPRSLQLALIATASLLLAACGTLPPPPAPATPRPVASGTPQLMGCDALASRFAYPGVRITGTERIAAGQLSLPGIAQAMPEHCVVKGAMNERTSPVDNKRYAISFEMRLPVYWNGRFFHQANGGLDGFVTPAYGDILGGGPASNGLLKGFAVLSSDAGHAFDRTSPIGGAAFGVDPQARRDYGYNAVAQLTPMAKSLIQTFYGKRPDTSYMVGTSNGGRHGFVAASRLPNEYDGVLASAPGFNLPQAAVAQVWGAQQFARVSPRNATTQRPELTASFSPADLQLVARAVLARCDALDGLADGLVNDVQGCQKAFRIERDVPTCTNVANPGACLPVAHKAVLARVFDGPVDSAGTRIYSGLPWDSGIAGRDWAQWKLSHSVGPRDAVALAFVFTTPPASPAVVTGQGNTLIDYALGFSLDRDAGKIWATDAMFTDSAMNMMTPTDRALRSFTRRGGKLLVAHGTADPVFSALDTIAWWDGYEDAHRGKARDSARLFLVPGMNHSRGGPAADQMDLVDALVNWVERGQAPDAIVAQARGAGSAVPNPEVPAGWSPQRTRLLCAYPTVARYQSGDPESAASFRCTPQ